MVVPREDIQILKIHAELISKRIASAQKDLPVPDSGSGRQLYENLYAGLHKLLEQYNESLKTQTLV